MGNNVWEMEKEESNDYVCQNMYLIIAVLYNVPNVNLETVRNVKNVL